MARVSLAASIIILTPKTGLTDGLEYRGRLSPSSSPPPPYQTTLPRSPSPAAQPRPSDPLRHWFLTHLSAPFASPTDKSTLEALTGLTRKSIEEHLTNWRRRSRWTELMHLYGGGSREGMKALIEGVERGEETRADVLERVEGVRAYVEERARERLGDWVKEVSPETLICVEGSEGGVAAARVLVRG